MMYYLPWLLLTMVSIGVAFAWFFWGVKNGQFLDQDRARYLPLRDFEPSRAADPGRSIFPKMIVLALLAITAAMMAGVLYISFSRP